MFKPKTEHDKGFVAGLKTAADYIAQFNAGSRHEYRLDDCILCKFNVSQRKRPRPNPPRALYYKFRGTVQRWLGGASAGCQGIPQLDTGDEHFSDFYGRVGVPGITLPEGTVLDVEVISTVVKTGKRDHRRCVNPWPGHFCDDVKHRGPTGAR